MLSLEGQVCLKITPPPPPRNMDEGINQPLWDSLVHLEFGWGIPFS